MAVEKWEIDSSHSGIHFSVRHMVVAKVRGQFARWSGRLVVENGALTGAKATAIIDTSSIETGVTDRDAHLKSADFLDVARFPEMTFTSTRVEKNGVAALRVTGQLTIRGVTREVVLDVESAGQTTDPGATYEQGSAQRPPSSAKTLGSLGIRCSKPEASWWEIVWLSKSKWRPSDRRPIRPLSWAQSTRLWRLELRSRASSAAVPQSVAMLNSTANSSPLTLTR